VAEPRLPLIGARRSQDSDNPVSPASAATALLLPSLGCRPYCSSKIEINPNRPCGRFLGAFWVLPRPIAKSYPTELSNIRRIRERFAEKYCRKSPLIPRIVEGRKLIHGANAMAPVETDETPREEEKACKAITTFVQILRYRSLPIAVVRRPAIQTRLRDRIPTK